MAAQKIMVIGGDHVDFLRVAVVADLRSVVWVGRGGQDGFVFFGVTGRVIAGQMAGVTIKSVRLPQVHLVTT